MFAVERDIDSELVRAWQMLQELVEQQEHNQKLIATLKSRASSLKEQAIHNRSGYALRRFNVDISQEFFDSELERMNAQIIIENQAFLHENKQLSMLLKEYEHTLETVMTKFRNHALAAQQHELTLTRHYEALLLSRESNSMGMGLSNNTQMNTSLQRLSEKLRMLLRSLAGEDTETLGEVSSDQLENLGELLEDGDREDWALERECEIERITKENEELRRLLGIDTETAEKLGVDEQDLKVHRPVIPHLKEALAHATPSENWGNRGSPQPQVLSAPPATHTPVPSQGISLQRTVEFQPGMRATASTLRRPSMFGQRGRGTGPLWAPAPNPDRPWGLSLQGNSGSGLDLAG